MATKNEIFDKYLKEYLHADKDGKGAILDLVCTVTAMHRKAAIRKFWARQRAERSSTERRGRHCLYTADVTAALQEVWQTLGEPCGENLHPVVAEHVAALTRDRLWDWGEEVTKKLLQMSEGTMKRRVGKFLRSGSVTHGKSTTSPSSIHAVIPIRSGPWDTAPVGTEQLDTVAHCGDTVAGDYVMTVNATDVATLWGERQAQWNKGQAATVRSMEAMEQRTPFPILERHPDSGSEFINWHCQQWSEQRGQQLTRSRPNHKNDNCFVEERNGHVIRRWVGYTRFDAREVVEALNDLYAVLTPLLNHFSASRRLISKERVGARWQIKREKKSLTPYQRVLGRDDVAEEIKQRLYEEHERLNPLILKREIDRRWKIVFTQQQRHGKPKFLGRTR